MQGAGRVGVQGSDEDWVNKGGRAQSSGSRVGRGPGCRVVKRTNSLHAPSPPPPHTQKCTHICKRHIHTDSSTQHRAAPPPSHPAPPPGPCPPLTCSDALPPNMAHTLSSSCSLVISMFSLGRYCAKPSVLVPRGTMDTWRDGWGGRFSAGGRGRLRVQCRGGRWTPGGGIDMCDQQAHVCVSVHV